MATATVKSGDRSRAPRSPRGIRDDEPFLNKEELAGMVGASRERVNKAISSFIRLGWIEQHERRYKILLRDRLELRSR